MLISKKPVVLLAVAMTVMVATVLLFGYLAVSEIGKQHQVTRDFYEHPFKVSNAATQLRNELAQIRLHMLHLFRATDPLDAEDLMDEVLAHQQNAEKQMVLIRQAFLGDSKRVEELDRMLQVWARLHAEIFDRVESGQSRDAIRLASAESQAIYDRAYELISYISAYSLDKAAGYERKAALQYRLVMNNLYWLMGLVVLMMGGTGAYALTLIYIHSRKLEEDAYTDSLTGLLNRQHFLVMCDNHVEMSKRYGTKLSLLFLDLDRFKEVNDRFGHNAGDDLLRQLAAMLKRSVRASDMVCRWGGEEFIILMPGVDADEACLAARRINSSIGELRVVSSGKVIGCSGSIGVAQFDNQDHIGLLIDHADRALYEAKEKGRDRVVRYGESRSV